MSLSLCISLLESILTFGLSEVGTMSLSLCISLLESILIFRILTGSEIC